MPLDRGGVLYLVASRLDIDIFVSNRYRDSDIDIES